MNAIRFDRIAQLFAGRRGNGNSVATTQEATPEVEAFDPANKTHYLFVQSFENGTIAPKEDAPDTYTITLQHGLGQTIYFADRPSRDVGATPTLQFLEGLGFSDDNPPNAALVIDDGNGGTDIAVVELRHPLFDPVSPGVIYDINVLGEWEQSLEMGFSEVQADLSNLPATFGPAHLFIDDCMDANISCCDEGTTEVGRFGVQPFCWTWANWACVPCVPYYHQNLDAGETQLYWILQCRAQFANCNDRCFTAWDKCSPGGNIINGIDF